MNKLIIINRKKKIRFCCLADNQINLSKFFLDLVKIIKNCDNNF